MQPSFTSAKYSPVTNDDINPFIFPKKTELNRIEKYEYFDRLYRGEHFTAFSIKGEKEFTERYNRMRYIVCNFPGLISRTIGDLLFGDKLVIDVDKNQLFIDALIRENSLETQLYESSLANSARGDSVFKIRSGQRNPKNVSDPITVIIEEVSAAYYFPNFENGARNVATEDVLAWIFYRGKECYMHKETHIAGYIYHEVFRYDASQGKIISNENPEDFGYVPIEETGIKRSLVTHIPNMRDGNGFFGTSDYNDLHELFFALNNRITKIDNILDKHSDPILAVPPGVLDESGQVKKESLGMFEVDNENGSKPEYIVWNANLESAFKQVDKMIEMLYMFSEISPASSGLDKGGVAESGRALKYKMLRTISKRNRKRRYYDQGIKSIVNIAQEFAAVNSIQVDGESSKEAEVPSIIWSDGVLLDETEQIDNAIKRIDNELSSRPDEIAKIDEITPEQAAEKVKDIDNANRIDAPKNDIADKKTDPNDGK